MTLYASSEVHNSVPRAWRVLPGSGEALRLVPVDDAYRIDVAALRARVAADRAAGLSPVLRRRHGRNGEHGRDRRPHCDRRLLRRRGPVVPLRWRVRRRAHAVAAPAPARRRPRARRLARLRPPQVDARPLRGGRGARPPRAGAPRLVPRAGHVPDPRAGRSGRADVWLSEYGVRSRGGPRPQGWWLLRHGVRLRPPVEQNCSMRLSQGLVDPARSRLLRRSAQHRLFRYRGGGRPGARRRGARSPQEACSGAAETGGVPSSTELRGRSRCGRVTTPTARDFDLLRRRRSRGSRLAAAARGR